MLPKYAGDFGQHTRVILNSESQVKATCPPAAWSAEHHACLRRDQSIQRAERNSDASDGRVDQIGHHCRSCRQSAGPKPW